MVKAISPVDKHRSDLDYPASDRISCCQPLSSPQDADKMMIVCVRIDFETCDPPTEPLRDKGSGKIAKKEVAGKIIEIR